jgi:protein O-mannosyl-transferase
MAKSIANKTEKGIVTLDNKFLSFILPYSFWLVALSALLLYANTLGHGFILDDSLVITQNEAVKNGLGGMKEIFSKDFIIGKSPNQEGAPIVQGGRYRPLSVAFFAIVYQVFGNNPFPFHLFQILFYALTCTIFLLVLRKYLTYFHKEATDTIALLSALLFVFHPVHTEVVCNVKSLDEIFALLFSLLSWYMALRYTETKKSFHLFLTFIAFLAASFSKENSVTYLPGILLSVFFIPEKKGRDVLLKIAGILIGAFLIYFTIRGYVMGWKAGTPSLDLMNNPFILYDGLQWVHMTFGQKFMTIMLGLGKYLQLLLVPITLSSDYYPRQIPIGAANNPFVWISLLLWISLVYFTIRQWRQNNLPFVLGMLLFCMPLLLVSNLFFPVGTNIAERFLFMPTAGIAIAAAWLIYSNWSFAQYAPTLGIVLCLWAIRVISRNPDYVSNEVLSSFDVQVTPNSAKMQNMRGGLLLKEGNQKKDLSLVNQAIEHYRLALKIHPTYPEALYGRGSAYLLKNDIENAYNDLNAAYQLVPYRDDVRNNYLLVTRTLVERMVNQGKDLPKAQIMLNEVLMAFPNDPNGLLTQVRIHVLNNQTELAKSTASQLRAAGTTPEIDSLLNVLGINK